jgi:phosphate transport system protein
MFKKLLELLRRDNLLEQAYRTSVEMLQTDLDMFKASVNSLRKRDDAELPFDIHQKDKEINRYEREVRKDVLTHLSISGTSNLTAALSLVSVVIDIERIGDYTKNISELAAAHPQKLSGGIFEEELADIEKIVQERFGLVIKALSERDIEPAKKVMDDYRVVSRRCDQTLNDIIAEKDKTMKAGHAVVLALYFRYLKRISGHLINISSSMVNPFPRIGFRVKRRDK